MPDNKKLYCAAAVFDTPDGIIHAAEAVRDAGYKKFDVNTPYPLHGMDRSMGLKPTKLGFVTLFFGFSGASLILFFMWWAMTQDYPLIIGGKPFFALPAFIPITFETAVLLGALSTVFGMIAAFFNLPKNSHPLHDTEYLRKTSSDKYGIYIEAEDPLFDEQKVSDLFKKLNASLVELIYEPEKEEYRLFAPNFIIFLAITAVVVSFGTYITLNKLMYIQPFDWMSVQDKVTAQEKSDFFRDGFGMRKPVEGTVARGLMPYPYKGLPAPTVPLTNPLLPTKEVLELGQKKFLTFCSPCHGNHADGDSRLNGQFPNPPTLHSQRAREFSDGMIYHIITNGQNVMPSYASQISRDERWAIVNYVRVLQRAKNAKDTDLKMIKKEPVANVEK